MSLAFRVIPWLLLAATVQAQAPTPPASEGAETPPSETPPSETPPSETPTEPPVETPADATTEASDAPSTPETSTPDPTSEGSNETGNEATPASAESRPTPRVAVVLVGDPDPSRSESARALDLELGIQGLERLADPAMRLALLGEAHENDGLDRLHASRRALLFADDPSASLLELGQRLQVDVLVVVRATEPARLAVFDVRARAFFEEEPLLTDVRAASFIRRAALAAARRSTTAPEAAARAEVASEPTPAPEPDPRSPARRWLRANWAYLVGGALLVGVITGFVVRGRRNDDTPPPLL
ncbi:MAG: hypothetical protein R3B99_38065, partial [Polyangiales bacterium]